MCAEGGRAEARSHVPGSGPLRGRRRGEASPRRRSAGGGRTAAAGRGRRGLVQCEDGGVRRATGSAGTGPPGLLPSVALARRCPDDDR